MRKYLVLIVAFTVMAAGASRLHSTAQVADILHYKGEKMWLFSNPLEDYYKSGARQKPAEFFDKGSRSTACWRGYKAEWEIKDDKLYLVSINECHGQRKANLKDFFPNVTAEGRVFAEWYSGRLTCPRGKMTKYVHMGYASRYESYLYITVENGNVVKAEESKERLR